MKKLLMSAMAAGLLAGAAAPALAQSWVSINQRQAQLDHRIDQGVRNGTLTRNEAASLRDQFRSIVALEATYRRTGGVFTTAERVDLDRRMNALGARIRAERSDQGFMNINQRQAQLDTRIDQGIRNRTLSPGEAIRLRAEFRTIVALEATYRRSGNVFTAAEKNDLNRRMDVLMARIKIEKRD